MRYRLGKTLTEVKGEDAVGAEELLVEVLSLEAYREAYGNMAESRLLQRDIQHIGYCKADIFKHGVVGNFSIPSKKKILENCHNIGFYLDGRGLVFVDDSGYAAGILAKIEKNQFIEQTSVSHLLFEFMEHLLRDDVRFLRDYEDKMTEMEESLFQNRVKDCPAQILKIRRELLKLNSYYDQMVDVCETMEEYQVSFSKGEEVQYFHLMAERASRMADNVKNLREYTLQLREMYQTQTAERQNKIMQFLTVVTTIFMPLTLLTGWYGMNFANMPELRYEGSYFVLMIIAVVTILIEIMYFRHKNWFH